MSEEKGLSVWNKLLGTVLNLPGVKVDRKSFLESELKSFCSPEKLKIAIESNPTKVLDMEIINHLADSCINNHTIKVTAISTVAGIPGGLGMAVAIPGDIAQYYFHVFVLAQKLAYLYGFPDLCDEKGQLTENAQNMLTVFVGIMMGAAAANKVITDIARRFGKEVTKRLPQQALMRTVYYPIIKKIAKWIGIRMTRSTFGKVVGKAIPILGGVISGALTLASFRPGAKRLQRKLIEQKDWLNGTAASGDTNTTGFDEYEEI